ncbi:MAG: coproporphyrinogen dehydrogenase HemZ [Mobilitalea sp.]
MIEIIISNKAFENDVYPLMKAFYPQETIKVYGAEEIRQSDLDLQKNSDRNEYKETNHSKKILLSVEEEFQKAVNLNVEEEYPLDKNLLKNMAQGNDKNADIDHRMNRISEIVIEFLSERIDFRITFIEGNKEEMSLTLADKLKKTQYKNSMKRFLYAILAKNTGRSLPWGILTGIRPTKLVYELLEEGKTDIEVYTKMKEEYLCSEAKIAMSIKIARREAELLKEMDYQNGYSLYIGIPFCPSTCLYCSFTSYSIEKFAKYVDAYLDALEKEIVYSATCFPDKKLTTVYFGGGTPTTLTAEQLDRLLGLVRKYYDFTYVKEFCVEAGRPDSITREKLEVLKKWGVDRISINPQTMQQRTLDLVGRKHTVEQIKEAFLLARETGHDNINMDIIIGLPGENQADVVDTLSQIKELNPESLTVHTLAIKRAARLNLEKDDYADLKASDVPDMMEQTIQYAESNDYLPYYLYRQKNMADNLENIGYSKYGKEGLYNILIMEEQQTILALGAGGMSKFVFHKENRIERVDNVKSVMDYINRIDEMIERKKDFIKNNY